MTLAAALRGLHSDPYDLSSPKLSVFEGDLTPADEAKIDLTKPYAIVLGLPENVRDLMLSGNANIRRTVDVVLEYRGQNGERPHRKILTALRDQILRLAPSVEEVAYQIPFTSRLRYTSGTMPEAKYQEPTVLTATCRFQGAWRMKLGE